MSTAPSKREQPPVAAPAGHGDDERRLGRHAAAEHRRRRELGGDGPRPDETREPARAVTHSHDLQRAVRPGLGPRRPQREARAPPQGAREPVERARVRAVAAQQVGRDLVLVHEGRLQAAGALQERGRAPARERQDDLGRRALHRGPGGRVEVVAGEQRVVRATDHRDEELERVRVGLQPRGELREPAHREVVRLDPGAGGRQRLDDRSPPGFLRRAALVPLSAADAARVDVALTVPRAGSVLHGHRHATARERGTHEVEQLVAPVTTRVLDPAQRRAPAGLAHDERRRGAVLAHRHGLTAQPREQEPHRGLADTVEVRVDRRQARREPCAEVRVVEGDDRLVARDRQARLAESGDEARGVPVGRDDDGGGAHAVGEHEARGGLAAELVVVARGVHPALVGLDVVGEQGLAICVETFAHVSLRETADEPDRAVPVRHEVLDGRAHAVRVVGQHDGRGAGRDLLADQHHGDAGTLESREPVVRQRTREHDEPVDRVDRHGHVIRRDDGLALQPGAIRLHRDDTVPAGAARPCDTCDHSPEIETADDGRQHADGAAGRSRKWAPSPRCRCRHWSPRPHHRSRDDAIRPHRATD
ncbi:hypothetical protein CPER28S_00229 [Cellulomonas persica]